MYAGIAGLGISGLQPGTNEWLAYASLAALITGGLLILARIARLGFLADFISRTVLVGFLTGVGIQVALGQLAGMLGVPSARRQPRPGQRHGDQVLGHAEGDPGHLARHARGLARGHRDAVVFEKWIPMIPGGLVAVVGAIAISWAFDLEAHGVSTLGTVPSGLPSIGLPSGVGWDDVVPLLATCVSMFLVIIAQSAATSRAYAVKYKEHFEENTDIVGLSVANLAAGFSSTFVVNGSPTKSKMAEEAKASQPGRDARDGGDGRVVLLFLTKPLQYMPNAVLAAVVFVIGVKLIDWKHMNEIYRLRRDEFWIAAITAAVVVGVGVEQGIILAIVLSLLDHVKRHYNPHDSVITRDEQGIVTVPAEPGRSPSRASSSIASGSGSSMPTRRASPRRRSPSSTSPSRRGGSSCLPTRWTTSTSPAGRPWSSSPSNSRSATSFSRSPTCATPSDPSSIASG